LEDIDRIEVIRGAGASLWGSNAVNGIINIISKHSRDTQGSLIFAGIGTEERYFGGTRYGDKLGEKSLYRIYAKYFNRDEAVNADGDGASDGWNMFRAGFRADSKLSDRNEMTLQGDIYRGESGEFSRLPSVVPPYLEIHDKDDNAMSGGYIMGRWKNIFSDTSDMALQICYDRTEKEELEMTWSGDTWDFDFQHRFAPVSRHEIIWGLRYRFYHDKIRPSFTVNLDPTSREDHLFSAFVQDDITLVKDRIRLTLGSKFEHNDYTGFEIQPNLRILWTPHNAHSLWAAVSRVVRSSSRMSRDIRYAIQVIPPLTPANPNSFPVTVLLSGNRDIVSEELIALEAGHRLNIADHLSLDMAAFYNFYDNLISFSPNISEISSETVYMPMDNMMEGKNWGLEIAANWQPLTWCRLQTAYTYIKADLYPKDDADTEVILTTEGSGPVHQLSFRSSADLSRNLECDVWIRYVDEIMNGDVEDYVAVDVRLGWKPLDNLDLSVVGRNLFDSHHPEFIETFIKSRPAEAERSVYGKISWQF